MAKMLDHSEAIIRGDAPPPPIARLIGFDLISVKPGEGVVEFQATEAHTNPMGTLHGGVLCDIADIAMGVAYSSNLDEGESFTTNDAWDVLNRRMAGQFFLTKSATCPRRSKSRCYGFCKNVKSNALAITSLSPSMSECWRPLTVI
jgi:acyl-coenzyme A thioesterase PaaI-like protein